MGCSQTKIDSFDNLYLRIRTLGYPSIGESMMISLVDKDKVLYNVFIDDYEINSYQYWIGNLPKDTRIDAFIWTHPDEDHSMGVDNLLKTFDPNKKAQIYLPSSLTKKLLNDNGKTKALDCYNYLKKNYNSRKVFNWNEISLCNDEGIRYVCQRKFTNRQNITITFRIGFMLPNSAIINRRVDKRKMNSGEMNHLSLFTVIELNCVRYIFAGDLANINIQFLKDEILDNCRFVKIPHHGSKDPIKLVDKIQQAQDHKMHSVTTTFGGEHPYNKVLNKYAQKSHAVYCTGRGNNQYGLVDIKYNVTMPSTYVVKLEGNAREVRSLSDLSLPTIIN